MSPNTTPSAPTTMADAAALTGEAPSPPLGLCAVAGRSGTGDGRVSSGAMIGNAAGTGGGRGCAPAPSACQRAKSVADAGKGLDLAAARAGHWPMVDFPDV